MPLDLDEILGAKSREPAVTTSIRLPKSEAMKLKEIAKSQRMSVTKLLRNLIAALIRDYEVRYGTKRR
jgi:predicted DNA-binding ribbon-helix-helix protein